MKRSRNESKLSQLTVESLQTSRDALAVARGAIALAGSLTEGIRTYPQGEILNAEELTLLAVAVPKWNVLSGISEGKPYKTFTRYISKEELAPERRTGGELHRNTYLSLGGEEYPDAGLCNIFDVHYLSGGALSNDNYLLEIHSNNHGPITRTDYAQVFEAETYLINEKYIVQVNPELTDAGILVD